MYKEAVILMQGNAPSHPSKYHTAWLASKGLKVHCIITWSLQYLNPTDNLGGHRKDDIYNEGRETVYEYSLFIIVHTVQL